MLLKLLRNLLSLTIHEIGSQTPKARDFQCWDRSPFTGGSSSDPVGALLDSLHTPLPHSQTSFPRWFNPRFLMADVWFHKAIYPWCSNTGRAKASASEEHTQQRKSWSLSLDFPPESLGSAPSVSIHIVGHRSSSHLLSKNPAIPSSCYVSVSIHLADVTHLHALFYPKGWQFTAPFLGLTCRAQLAFGSASQ